MSYCDHCRCHKTKGKQCCYCHYGEERKCLYPIVYFTYTKEKI